MTCHPAPSGTGSARALGGSTGYRFSCVAGTIFENTNKPLRDWFKIAHLMLTSKKGMSARQLGRYYGLWLVTKPLLAHGSQNPLGAGRLESDKLGGIVEVDETWVGGKDQNHHWDKRQRRSRRFRFGQFGDHWRGKPRVTSSPAFSTT